MKKILFIVLLLGFAISDNIEAQNQITIEVLNEDKTSESFFLDWPFNGPPPIGDEMQVALDSLNKKLSKVCPPERKKISDNIWKCGNGKKIKSNDRRLERAIKLIDKS